MSDVVVTVRVPKELADRIDEVRGEAARSAWARGVLEAAVSGNVPVQNGTVVEEAKKASEGPRMMKESGQAKPVKQSRRDADAAVMLAHVEKRPRHLRKIAEELGWFPMRVNRALDALGDSVTFGEGMVRLSGASTGEEGGASVG